MLTMKSKLFLVIALSVSINANAGPYIGGSLNYIDTTPSGNNPVTYGDSRGQGYIFGYEKTFDEYKYYGIELEQTSIQTRNLWGGKLSGLFAALRFAGSEMGGAKIRIGIVESNVHILNNNDQTGSHVAVGLGMAVMEPGSVGLEISGTGIFGDVVGNDELSIFALKMYYGF